MGPNKPHPSRGIMCTVSKKMAGVECEFVEKPPKAVQSECPICLLVLREPYQATCCGKSFCKECIEQIKVRNGTCPTCKTDNFFSYPNKGLQQSLNDFEVYCSHKSKGCEWRGELRELDKHLNSDPPADKSLEGCPFTVIKCPLSCASCKKGVCRKDVKAHVNDKLLNHVLAQNVQMQSIERRLEEVIGTNAQLTMQIQEVLGVNTQLTMELQNVKKHKQRLEHRVTELEERVNKLEVNQPSASKPAPDQPSASKQPSTYRTGTVKPRGVEFTMTRFEEYKREDDSWYSPHFYTHPGGYKMCLKVIPNGDTDGKSTHLAVRICMMKGESDNQLKWPFKGDITVELLSQEDEDHFVKLVPFKNATARSCSRVVEGERVEYPWGFSQFLPHTKLKPKYLKNDSIKLRIKKIDLV